MKGRKDWPFEWKFAGRKSKVKIPSDEVNRKYKEFLDDDVLAQERAGLPDSFFDNFHVKLIWNPSINCDIGFTSTYRSMGIVDLSDGEKF